MNFLRFPLLFLAIYSDPATAGNPYFKLYERSCGADTTDCCENPPINPLTFDIEFLSVKLDNASKPWQLDANITWEPTEEGPFEYAVRLTQTVSLEELETYDRTFIIKEADRYCLEKDEILTDSCPAETFFETITNETNLYVEDLMFGFLYRFEIQVITDDTIQSKYYCFNSCHDVLPKTLAPDCYELTRDREFCKTYPVPISGAVTDVDVQAECIGPDDPGWTVNLTWSAPVHVNGNISQYEILVRTFKPLFPNVYNDPVAAAHVDDPNATYSYTIPPEALVSGQLYVIDIKPMVVMPEEYKITELVSGGRGTYIFHASESIWCPTTEEATTPSESTYSTTGQLAPKEANVAGIVIGGVVAVIVLALFVILLCRFCRYGLMSSEAKGSDGKIDYIPDTTVTDHCAHNIYSAKEEARIPAEFRGKEILDRADITVESEPLGRGEFGEVYKGTLMGLEGKKAPITVAFKTPIEARIPAEFRGKEILDRADITVESEPLGRGEFGEVYKGTLMGLEGKKAPITVAFKTPIEARIPAEFRGKEILDRADITVESEPLGRGQYGEVYKGTLMGLEGKKAPITVAFKTPIDDASLALKEDFLDEIKLMVEIGDHPHIMLLYGCCTMDEPYYLITEYMTYGALDKFLFRCRKPESANVDKIYELKELNQVQIALQISKGMSFLSTTRYFHGDLAARNCLVGEYLLVKVSDFGLSDDIYQRGYKRIAPEKKRPVKWYSPEANLEGVCSTKGDVWSFGIVMWEIYSLGENPYPRMPFYEVVRRVNDGYRMSQPQGCPLDVFSIMSECWQHSPGSRPTFHELEYALEIILKHREETAAPLKEGDSPDLPMVEETPTMTRRESSLADKIYVIGILGSSSDSVYSDMSNTSSASFVSDYNFPSGGTIEPILEDKHESHDKAEKTSTDSVFFSTILETSDQDDA